MKRKAAFWDTSALVPFCVQERTSNKVKALSKRYDLVVWWSTAVEIRSAIARLHRSGELDDAGRQAALARLSVLRQSWREILPSDKLRAQAEVLLDAYSLRAADSLQLASAMIWCRQRSTLQPFVSSDGSLCRAATQAGFAVLNPGLPTP